MLPCAWLSKRECCRRKSFRKPENTSPVFTAFELGTEKNICFGVCHQRTISQTQSNPLKFLFTSSADIWPACERKIFFFFFPLALLLDGREKKERKVSLPFSCACQVEQFVGMKAFTTNFFYFVFFFDKLRKNDIFSVVFVGSCQSNWAEEKHFASA